MSNSRRINQHSRLTELLHEHASVEGRINYLETRREEIQDLIRMRVRKSLSCVGYRGKTSTEDVALGLAESFPQVREILGFASFKATAAWILEDAR